MQPRKVLGIAASLRNGRWGPGSRNLIERLSAIPTREELFSYLSAESQLHIENFLEAGRREGKDFLEIYDSLRKKSGDAGLSNSEVALAAALWAAHREGAAIDHLSLTEYFTASGQQRHTEKLRAQLMAADGLLISGPVYFGDRGSLVESLIEFIRGDAALRAALRGRPYAGIAVGAKRNGGQETTLVYQMLDMANLELLVVGNDSENTAQYGGTGVAGDVGTMHKDSYGLDTSMGTGRRLARVLKQLSHSDAPRPPRVLFLVLQDHENIGRRLADRLTVRFARTTQSSVVDLTGARIKRCLACDICPTHVGPDDEYRCIITSGADALPALHAELLDHDLIVPVAVCVSAPTTRSRYQLFVERSRYLRRGDYAWSDAVVAPLVIEERDRYGSMVLRMMTSFLRHHTVLIKPLVGHLRQDAIEGIENIEQGFASAVAVAARMAAGRPANVETVMSRRYWPIGYVLAADKNREDERLGRRNPFSEERRARTLATLPSTAAPDDEKR